MNRHPVKVLLHIIGAHGGWDSTTLTGDAPEVGVRLHGALLAQDHEGAHVTTVLDLTNEDVYRLAEWLRQGMPIDTVVAPALKKYTPRRTPWWVRLLPWGTRGATT